MLLVVTMLKQLQGVNVTGTLLQDLPAVIVAIITLQVSQFARWAHGCVDFCGQGKADAIKIPCKSEASQCAQSLLAQAKALRAW